MTALAQPRPKIAGPFAGIALAAALHGGIAGGAVAIAVPAALDARAAADRAAAHGAQVLASARDWEARYREMYPNSR